MKNRHQFLVVLELTSTSTNSMVWGGEEVEHACINFMMSHRSEKKDWDVEERTKSVLGPGSQACFDSP